jgi:hypothetical protein
MGKVFRVTSRSGKVLEVALKEAVGGDGPVASALAELRDPATGKHIGDATVSVRGPDLIVEYVEQGEERELLIEGAAGAVDDFGSADAADGASSEISPGDAGRGLEKAESAQSDSRGAAATDSAETAASGSGFGASGLLYGLLGVGVLGGAAAAAGGGKGGGSKSSAPADSVPPGAPTGLDLDAADDTGASATDNVTSQPSGLTLRGQAEANARVELFAGTTSLGTAMADGWRRGRTRSPPEPRMPRAMSVRRRARSA